MKLPSKTLHIVSFDVPYPPNYGGAIDVYFKLKALHQLGIRILFHCFEYGRGQQEKLSEVCHTVHYYERNPFLTSFLSTDPFIIKSRANTKLIENLNKDDHPVLFEGLHTTFPIFARALNAKNVFVRAHNIEHNYYKGLARSESNVFKRRFFKAESKRLKRYEKLLSRVNGVFTISPLEQEYFYATYGNHCHYIPAFHEHELATELKKSEPFVLYHGDVAISDNQRAAQFLIDVYKNSNIRLVIASNKPNSTLRSEIDKYDTISFVELGSVNSLNDLFEKAQVHALVTFQNTGIKLKLLNTLYQGRHIIANPAMIDETGLESLCSVASTKDEFLRGTKKLMETPYTSKERLHRLQLLENFHPLKSAKKMVDIIFKQGS